MKLAVQEQAPNFIFHTVYSQNQDFYAALQKPYNILYFSRYIGCSLCQLNLMKLAKEYETLSAANIEVFFIIQSTEENAKQRLEEMNVRFPVILDPEEKLYQLYGVEAAPEKIRPPEVVQQVEEARSLGIEHGVFEGNELQLPATFILDAKATIVYAHYGSNSADVPNSNELLAWLSSNT